MIGTGYVGLVSGVCFSDLGNDVICVDKDLNKINDLKDGKIPIYEPGLEELVKKNIKNHRLNFSTDLKNSVKKSDIIFICVGTPTNKGGSSADLTQVFGVTKELSKTINKYKIIITKSTVPVTTGDEIEKILLKSNSRNKFSVVSNPEFLREGEAIRDFIYASNAFLATKITFINELANLCEKTNINVDDISIGMGLDQRIGSRFLRAGPAYGGSCFPKDTKAITSTADRFSTNLSVIKSVIKSNENRSELLLKRVYQILNNKVKNKKISFLGVTFKANTDDMRDSSSLRMIPALSKKGAFIRYFDPTGYKKEFKKFKNVSFSKSISRCLEKTDLVIIHTEWNDFKSLDFLKLIKNKKIKIYDMRNLYTPDKMTNKDIEYFSVGRG
jgi:UDPglucose 6-dehydrogenase